ncbi:hypothetical protein [Pseudomonas cichorii]|uniref:hypothetical protein n=1 Tax=Pseudomonas cichorii TaxID=36746 RepID=UPI001C8A1AB8|nr:hypothetical protein [Pseudomonas cichorii]MBX8484038.1 hypothetical protein [Pseudomonas cichorii]
MTDLIVDKNRHGPLGFCRVQHQGSYHRFLELMGYHLRDEEVEMSKDILRSTVQEGEIIMSNVTAALPRKSLMQVEQHFGQGPIGWP